MSQTATRVLVVEDTVTFRKIISDVLSAAPGIELVGAAANGKIALQKIEQLKPDILTLDLEMPEMDGLEVLQRLKTGGTNLGVIMLSALTREGAQATLKALELGAFDFIVKPAADTLAKNVEILRRQLLPKIEAYARTKIIRDICSGAGRPAPSPTTLEKKPAPPAGDLMRRIAHIAAGHPGLVEAVGIGISTGGPTALVRMLPQLPADLPAPVLIVQHMPPMFTKSLAEDLHKRCNLTVCEAADGQAVHAGNIYIAPGDKQMKVHKTPDGVFINITNDPPENSCRPAVDYLFRSLAYTYGPNTLGVIMTGMGNDGTLGCRLLKRQGGQIIAQDQASCVVYGMPKQPTEEGLADLVAPLDLLAQTLTRLVKRGVLVCR